MARSSDYALYDWGHYFNTTPAPDDIVIVAIDEVSLDTIGHWPWPRSLHAELLNKLAAQQTRAIGLDIVFSEPERSGADVDNALAHAIGQARNVVMPILLNMPYSGVSGKQLMPIPEIASQAAGLGNVRVPLDYDGTARSIYLWEAVASDGLDAAGLPQFAQSVLQVANQLPSSFYVTHPNLKVQKNSTKKVGSFTTQLASYGQRKVIFLGPPGHFSHISYAKVLAGDYPHNFFKDKIVLIGTTVAGLGEMFSTPFSDASKPMPGVEFHANVISAMRNQQLVSESPLWLTTLFCAFIGVMPLFWLHKLPPRKSMLAVAGYFCLVVVFMFGVLNVFHFWLPFSSALLAILFAYPIWQWRRLDSAQMFLDKELQYLRDELAVLGMEQEDTPDEPGVDPMQSRIMKIKLTAKHLRELHRGRSDTLAFISHDIRAPLGAAMMLLSEFEDNKHANRMKRMLGRAYTMAEGFLQASKAEMINVNKFHVLDMVSIAQQAVDDVYELAIAKRIKFVKIFPDDSLWIRGDFGLLLRALTNVLINAVNYSPEGATIKSELRFDDEVLTLEITDQGPGIPAAKVSKLFRRFSRVDAEHQSREGSGLGLYFVDVTIKKHNGVVSVKSQLGVGSTFIISLPLERRRDNVDVDLERRALPKPSFWDTI